MPEKTALTTDTHSFVFAVGGDGTFVRTAALVKDKNLPVIGVCSDSDGSACSLTSMDLRKQDRVAAQLDALYEGQVRFESRARLEVTIDDEEEPLYALNDALLADKHPTTTSYASLQVDERAGGSPEWCEFEHRGILVSTGSGSTGWMASALWKSAADVGKLVSRVDRERGAEEARTGEATARFNEGIPFKPDSNLMFYHIREPSHEGASLQKNGFSSQNLSIEF